MRLSFHWRQFSKSWRSSFLPYSARKISFLLLLFFDYPSKNNKRRKDKHPLCVSFYYYIYIVNVCFFEWHILHVFTDANFQKAGHLHSCLTPAPVHLFILLFLRRFFESTNSKINKWYQPLCVSFYYIIYIVNICFFEWSILYFSLTPIFKKLDAFIPAL